MKEQYLPKTLEQKLGYLVEEVGVVLAAVGKIQRWGTESVNLDLPPPLQETNREWLIRALADLKCAIQFVELSLGRDSIPHPDAQLEVRV